MIATIYLLKRSKLVFTIWSIALLAVYCISCNKEWLEAKANKTQTIPTTLSDYQALLANSFAMNYFAIALGEVASDGHHIEDASWLDANSTTRNAYSWSHSEPYEEVISWEATYNRIFYVNLILDGLEKMEPSLQSDKNEIENIKAQALFHRGEAFYWLAQLYAEPYDKESASMDMGIPLRLTSDISERSARSTVKQTYDQIIGDLKGAIAFLPDKPTYATYASKAAVYGVLARTYLSMQDYDSALIYSDKCIQLHSTLIDYNTLDPTSQGIGRFNAEVIFHNQMYTDETSGFISWRCLIDTTLYNTYDDNDLRKNLFFSNNSGLITFKGSYQDNSYELFCGIASDEMYLIRSECYARKGNTGFALSDLNTLLEKRWNNSVQYPVISVSTADEALALILLERKKELVLRGLRWSDLRRLNKEDRFKIAFTRIINSDTFNLVPNSYKYTFPIPDDVKRISGMLQSPGW